MKNKSNPFRSVLILSATALILAGGVILAIAHPATSSASSSAAKPVAATTLSDGKQMVEINVKEGYQPHEVAAKAGVPVVLQMKTQGTFDCSATFSIPKLGIHERLDATGVKSIEIPAQKAGDTLTGVCGMGMYSLVIKFS